MGAGAMTLAELQVILTANIAQVLPQVMEVRRAFGTLNESADQTGRSIDKTVSDTSAKAEKALDSQNKAEDKSAQETKKASQTKRQSLEEIAAIAQRAAERYNQSLAGMTGKPMEFSDNEPASSGKTATAILAARRQAEEAAQNITSAVDPSRMAQVQHTADQVRQSVDAMFAEERTGSTAADQAYDAMAAKLGNITARADVLRMRISQMRAEYAKVAEQSGADSPDALKLQNQILLAENRLAALAAQSDKTAAAMEDLKREEDDAGNAAQQMGRKVEEGSSHVRAASSSASGFQRALSRMGRQIISQILVWQLFFGAVGALGTYMWNALKTNTAFSNSLNNLKVQLLTAFQPIYQAALPALTSLINALAKAMAYIAAFTAGLFGTTYAAAESGAAALNKQVNALQDTAKAANTAKKALAGFDEINQLTKTSSATGKATGADAGLLNTDFSAPSANAPISPGALESVQKIGNIIRQNIASISAVLAGASLVLGAILTFTGANIPLGIGLMIAGGLGVTAIAMNWGKLSDGVKGTIAGIAAVVTPALLVLGSIFAFTGVNIPLGIAFMAMGAGSAAVAALNWDAITPQIKGVIATIADAVGLASLVLGAIFTFTGVNIPLGIAFLAMGATGATAAALDWNTIPSHVKNVLSVVSAVAGGALLALGLVLALTGAALPLGIGLIAVGALSLGGAVALNLEFVASMVKNALTSILAIASTAGIAIGLLLCLTGAGIPLGIGLILAGMTGIHAAGQISTNPITDWARGIMNGIISIFERGINYIVFMLNQMSFTVPDWVLGIGGQKFGINLPRISIPRLASGGIVSSATAFVAGEAGSEAVLPLQRNTGWMDMLAAKVAAQVPQGASNLTVTMPVYLDGREIYTNQKKYALRDARGSNAPAFI